MKIVYVVLFSAMLFSCKERTMTQKDYERIADISYNDVMELVYDSLSRFTVHTSIMSLAQCTSLVMYADTPFTVLVIPFLNRSKVNPLWWYGDNRGQAGTTDLAALIKTQFPSFKYSKLYKRNNTSCLIIDGTESTTIPWYRFWSRDSTGLKHTLASYPRSFYLYGALSYTEAIGQAKNKINIKSFHNRGQETWTQSQRDNYNRTVMHYKECKKGEYRADFRFPSTQIRQSIIDSARTVYQWQIILQ